VRGYRTAEAPRGYFLFRGLGMLPLYYILMTLDIA
jgi:hypothetical protein